MSSEIRDSLVPVHVTASDEAGLKLYEKEIATYLCELPRLLKEGHAGRVALIRGNDLLKIWDTQADAIQDGRRRFGLEPIFVKVIDSRDSERFAHLEAWKKSQSQP